MFVFYAFHSVGILAAREAYYDSESLQLIDTERVDCMPELVIFPTNEINFWNTFISHSDA